MLPLTLADYEIAAWLRLVNARGLGPVAVRRLLTAFGLPQQIFDQSYAALSQAMGANIADAVRRAKEDDFTGQTARVIEWASAPANHFVTLADPAYPRALLETVDPPPLLYVKGRLELLHAPSLAIVGSRHATAQGLVNAEQFARALADAGLCIVSGLALGIDGAAHRGALSGQAGTIAVIGTGADIVYPARHHALAHEIAVRGAIVSEWPLGAPARAAHFPQRNRLIAGLTLGTVIIEAAAQSGSLITARLAGEMGREVFAVPGSIHSPLTKGCHRLIKEGAKLVESAQDVLDELLFEQADEGARRTIGKTRKSSAYNAQRAADTRLSEPPDTQACADGGVKNNQAGLAVAMDQFDQFDERTRRIFDALGHDPAPLESLAARTGLASAELQAALLKLELGGWIAMLPGGRVACIKHV